MLTNTSSSSTITINGATTAATIARGGDLPITSSVEPGGDACSWRDVLPIHAAAEIFPLLAETDPAALKALGEDIQKNGLTSPIALWSKTGSPPFQLIDGRSRLDGMAAVGILDRGGPLSPKSLVIKYPDREFETVPSQVVHGDPYEYVASANLHRRHLTAEKRIEVAEKLAKTNPTMSARRIAKLANISPTTAVKAKTKVQETGDVSTVDTSISIDTKGRQQPAKKKARSEATPAATAKNDASSPTKTVKAETVADKTPPADEKSVKTEPATTPGGNGVNVEASAERRKRAAAAEDEITREAGGGNDEELALLREFADFILSHKITISNPADYREWKALVARVEAVRR